LSVELPEAVILAGQMGEVLPGKVNASYDFRDIVCVSYETIIAGPLLAVLGLAVAYFRK
jgi:hypothetical protein